MTIRSSLLRLFLAVCILLFGVAWAVLGLLLLAGALRGQGMFGEHGNGGRMILVVLWLGGMAVFFGAAVRIVRPALQSFGGEMEKARAKKK
ncbi:MAG TPA: hypothetical protein VMZ27_02795 [Candidatus Saccharimonadales bacterium]|nr:hypothetical protein [Candidatus Saccharimonadales bacterium]